MQHTENHHLNVSLPELNLLNYNQLEENVNFDLNETLLPTDVQINAVLHLEGENLMYSPLKFENDVKLKALIDTGACANAMPPDFHEKVRVASPNSLSELKQASFLNFKVLSGCNVKVLGQIDVQFEIIEHKFEDTLLILPLMNSVVLGKQFFRKYSIENSLGETILKLPEMTYELNGMETLDEGRKTIPKRRYPVVMSQKIILKPQPQEILQTKVVLRKNLDGHTGLIIPDEHLENSSELRLSSSLVSVQRDNIVSILAIDLNDHAVTFTKNKEVAVFEFFSPQEEEELIEIGPELLALDKMKDGEIFR